MKFYSYSGIDGIGSIEHAPGVFDFFFFWGGGGEREGEGRGGGAYSMLSTYNFLAIRVGAYSRWALIRINTVYVLFNLCANISYVGVV